jgi:hypothetical protein
MPPSFMTNYYNSLIANGLSQLVGNQVADCTYAPCASVVALHDYAHKNGQTPCPQLQITTCISSLTVTNNGTINNLSAAQTQACGSFQNSGTGTGTGTGTGIGTGTGTGAGILTIAGIAAVALILLFVLYRLFFRKKNPASIPSDVSKHVNEERIRDNIKR